MPMTIDGTPFKNVGREPHERGEPVAAVFGQVDAADDADRDGRAATAMPISISVPTMAFAMPPPGSPTGFGIFVKKSQFSEENPCLTT